ncbi:hypothetical protein TWF481_010313 [Arthrobotrys musiformis]|uniref:Uncharacterized protein n=1 Tax=Arthrobotrys musiformis TaxID=47236 RepID=A0AAV9W0J6_9PEZI
MGVLEDIEKQIAEIDTELWWAERDFKELMGELNSTPNRIRSSVDALKKSMRQLELVTEAIWVESGAVKKLTQSSRIHSITGHIQKVAKKDPSKATVQYQMELAHQSFENLFDTINGILQQSFDLHPKFSELLSAKVLPLDRVIKNLEDQIVKLEIQAKEAYKTAQSNSQQQRQAYNEIKEQLERKKNKLNSLKSQRKQFFVIINPIWAAIVGKDINITQEVVEMLEKNLSDQMDAVREAERREQKAAEYLRRAQSSRSQLRELGGVASLLIAQLTIVQGRLITLKDLLSRTILKIAAIKDRSEIAKDLSLNNEDYMEHVLEVCAAVLVDPRVEDFVLTIHQRILDLCNGKPPPAIATAATMVEKSLKDVKFKLRLEVAVSETIAGHDIKKQITGVSI